METSPEQPAAAGPQKQKAPILVIVAVVLLAAVLGIGLWIFGVHPSPAGPKLTEAQLQQQADKLIKAGDPAACTAIQDATYRSVCTNNIALNKAESTGDVSYCKQMDGKLVTQKYCEQQVVLSYSVKTNNVSVCKESSYPDVQELCTQNFYAAIAQKNQDPSACQQAASSSACTTNYYIQKMLNNPVSVSCSDFPAADTQSDCALVQGLFARASTTPITQQSFQATCQKVTTTAFKQFCTTFYQRISSAL